MAATLVRKPARKPRVRKVVSVPLSVAHLDMLYDALDKAYDDAEDFEQRAMLLDLQSHLMDRKASAERHWG